MQRIHEIFYRMSQMTEQPQLEMQAEPLAATERTFTDPRILRTRELLQSSLSSLLKEKEFEKISVQDITDNATVNRATFYAHYPDKFALLECLVAGEFNALLVRRGVIFEGGCSSALRGFVLGVCDFLAQAPGTACHRQRQMEPHMEAAVVAVVRGLILNGLRKHHPGTAISPEIRAATISWAIYGAAKEWVRTPDRAPSEQIAETIMLLVGPLMKLAD
jgi:AcrR family transcriptional regulator